MPIKFLSKFQNKIFARILVIITLLSLFIFSLFALVAAGTFKRVLDEHMEEMEEYSTDIKFLQETHEIFYLELNKINRYMLLILEGSLVLSIGVSFVISSNLTKNLKKLTKFAEEARAGNMGARVEINSKDEFSVLAQNFNHLLESLKRQQTETMSKSVVNASIVMNLSDGIVMFDEGGEISIINKAAEKILNINKDEVLGKNIKELSIPNISRLYEIMGRSIEEGWVDEHLSIWQSDKTKVYPVRASSVVDNGGNFLGFLAIIKNI